MFAGKQNVGCWRLYEARAENAAIKNIQEWLSLGYDQEMKAVAHLLIDLELIVKRINTGLGEK